MQSPVNQLPAHIAELIQWKRAVDVLEQNNGIHLKTIAMIDRTAQAINRIADVLESQRDTIAQLKQQVAEMKTTTPVLSPTPNIYQGNWPVDVCSYIIQRTSILSEKETIEKEIARVTKELDLEIKESTRLREEIAKLTQPTGASSEPIPVQEQSPSPAAIVSLCGCDSGDPDCKVECPCGACEQTPDAVDCYCCNAFKDYRKESTPIPAPIPAPIVAKSFAEQLGATAARASYGVRPDGWTEDDERQLKEPMRSNIHSWRSPF
jgi:hypothetical protein